MQTLYNLSRGDKTIEIICNRQKKDDSVVKSIFQLNISLLIKICPRQKIKKRSIVTNFYELILHLHLYKKSDVHQYIDILNSK